MTPRKPQDETKNRLVFLRQFLERPGEVASVIPSSKKLVQRLIAGADTMQAKTVVEYGPGTGAITEALVELLPAGTRYLAAEPNAAFREHLREAGFEIEIIAGYAQDIGDEILARAGEVDLVVSGLPCSIMPVEVLAALFESTHRILRPGGEYRQFVYTHTLFMPKMRQMMAMLRGRFTRVETSSVWLNFPPATIIRCVK